MEEIEEFRDIVGYEGLYQISNFGRVKSLERCVDNRYGTKSLKKEKILKNVIKNTGYLSIDLYKNNINKNFKIHFLVYVTFGCMYNSKFFEIDHLNRIRTDNYFKNLILVSKRNNHNNRSNNSKFGVGAIITNYNTYQSSIRINKKNIHIGNYETKEQASNKYQSVKHQIEEIEKITRNYDFKRTKIGNEYFLEFFQL